MVLGRRMNRKQSTRWLQKSHLKAIPFVDSLQNAATYTRDCQCHLVGDVPNWAQCYETFYLRNF
jgi:hypothetical protein